MTKPIPAPTTIAEITTYIPDVCESMFDSIRNPMRHSIEPITGSSLCPPKRSVI